MTKQVDIDVATIHRLLSERLRQEVIREVYTSEPDEILTGYLVAEALSQETSHIKIYVKLRHIHLPLLDAHEAVLWNEKTDHLWKGEHTEMLFECMEENFHD